ncbi:hypothetical protein Tsubulata_016265 [Turnera subulata]|uniref:Uncharacterized protein n=1 Tax=Turnera subulata TaxID=218843 RepID=A0A9Q0FP73_9ROSI|nr:hypothetical protein Tsubulata_016265 [Turnera subulata]
MSVTSSDQVTQYYGPAASRKEPPQLPVINSDIAAHVYGGFVIVEHGRTSQVRRYY